MVYYIAIVQSGFEYRYTFFILDLIELDAANALIWPPLLNNICADIDLNTLTKEI